jgi:intein/homing endonuclease
MKLIGLEDLPENFKIVGTEDNFVYMKLYKGKYTMKVKLPFETNEKLASLFGHILGDGCIKTKEENAYYTNKSKELIEEVKATIKELFGVEIKENFNNIRKFYEVYPPKTIAKFLVLCGFPKGQKTKQITTIPDWIKEGSNEIKVAFIRALFDDDSTVINDKGNRAISFGMNKKKSLIESHNMFMEDVRKILFSLGIYPNKIFKRKQPGDFIQLGFHIYGRTT